MKKIIVLLLFISASLWAELSFNDVQTLIDKQDYRRADIALQAIVMNHPNSAKAYYSLAQVKAATGDLSAARYALDKATTIDPQLSFAPSSAVASLREAIAPQTAKIVPIHQSSYAFLYTVLAAGIIIGGIYYYRRRYPTPTIVETPSRAYDTPTPSSRPAYTSPTTSRPTYRSSTYSAPTTTEVHHHHHDSNSGMSTLGTVAVAAGTAAVVSAAMSDHHSSHDGYFTSSRGSIVDNSPSYSGASIATDSSSRSSSWDNTSSVDTSWDEPVSRSSSTSSSWDDTPTRSSSWDDSSSSSSSWSDSSSSDSSWGD